jgi:aminopeptidase
MRDPRLDKLASVLVNYSTKVKKGDVVGILADPIAMPMVEAVYEAALKAGGLPFYVPRSESLQELLVAHGTNEQIATPPILMSDYIERVDVSIGLWVEVNSRFLSRYDSQKAALLQQARRPFLKRFMEREADGSLRWCGTQFPTHGSAQDAGMSLRQFEDFLFSAALLHLPDPAAAWREIEVKQQRVCDWLQKRKMLRFVVPATDGTDGTELRVDVDGATWINCCGQSNFPDGEVFAGPQGVEGHVNYTFPAVYQGHEVEGVRLKFKGGRVVEASARRGEVFLIKMLDQDAGARGLGEIAIGTNYGITQFMKNTLFDEKIGGTFHAAVGAGYPKSGSNNESGLHWDMVCDLRPRTLESGVRVGGATIEADGEVFHRDGLFLMEGWPGPA